MNIYFTGYVNVGSFLLINRVKIYIFYVNLYFYSCIDTDLMSYIFWDVITTDTFLEGIHFISVQLVARIDTYSLSLSSISPLYYSLI